MSSRLFEEIREKKGLCYSIYSQAIKYKDCGAFIIQLGLDKSKIDIAIAAILKELNKIKEICIGQKELDRAKDYFLGNLAMQLEHPAGRMFYLAENYLSLGKIYSLADVKHEIEKINAHDIMSFSSQIFNLKNMCISCVGNVEPGIEGIIRDTVSSFC
jgi:predicted Zn-dependent peptidase